MAEGKAMVTIPLKNEFVGLVVEVEIEEKPVQLILDTGAAVTFLSEKAAKRIGLKATTIDDANVRDASGTKLEVQYALTKRIALGDAWTVNEPVLIAKIPDGIADGVLGISTLADWDVRVNPAEKTLTLFPGGKAQPLDDDTEVRLICELVNPKASSSNPQGLRGMNLRVPVRLGNQALLAGIDTGYGGILQLPSGLMKKYAPDALANASPALVQSIGVSGRRATRTAKVPEFTFGPDVLRDLPTEVVDAVPGTGAERVGIIGLNMLRHYVMTFRFSSGELRLKPLGTVQEITRASTAGLNLGPGAFIMSVVADGPGAKAGLGAGDQLLEIEGLPLKTMTPAQFAAFTRLPPGTSVKIRYRRGAAEPAEVNVILIKR